jgi:S1-C subfamily serine protease
MQLPLKASPRHTSNDDDARSLSVKLFGVLLFITLVLVLGVLNGSAKVYKYKAENGQWCFTNDPSRVVDFDPIAYEALPNYTEAENLEERLARAFPPNNEIEEARNATVAIESPLGHGSGFFVSDDGYIITNKHVIQPSEELKIRINQIDRKLNAEKERLEVKHQELLRKRGTGDKRQSALKDIKRKKEILEKKLEEFQRLRLKILYPTNFKVYLVDGTEIPVSVVCTGYQRDLALLRIYGYKTPFIKPSDDLQLIHGQTLYAIGSPLDLSLKNTVTSGIFSGVRQFAGHPTLDEDTPYIQTNAQINRGNSGGPLITREGRVVGIITWIIRKDVADGLNFAIPIQIAINEFRNHLDSPRQSSH